MSFKNVFISDRKKLSAVKKRIVSDGAEKLQVVSDFDKTLTSCFVGGKKIPSLISILRDEKYLTPDYPEKAQALYDKYFPVEHDPNIPLGWKKELMHEWWSTHYKLLLASGLTRNDIASVARSEKISFRQGAVDFLEFLNGSKIPLIILSSAGLGFETIEMYLENHNAFFPNIHIVSNELIWDESGKAIGVREPIIHTFSKNYSAVKNFDFYEKIKNRKNVILLGDGTGDAEMIDGFDYDNIIRIGFLNENVEIDLDKFRNSYDILILKDDSMDYIFKSFVKAFDVVLLDDAPMDFVNVLMKELVFGK